MVSNVVNVVKRSNVRTRDMKSGLISRRELLASSAIGIASSVLGFACVRKADSFSCDLTPEQTEGPFYPADRQLDEDSDLTFVAGRSEKAEGQVIYIRGQVVDGHCRPVQGTTIEIWQASAQGRYNHPRESRNPVPLDPNFQSWGRAITDQEGQYLFKTVIPGQYPAGRGWIRPSHIHFRVVGASHRELTTQMYFSGDRYLDSDFILRDIPREQRHRVIVERQNAGGEFEPDTGLYQFDLTVRPTS